MSEWAEYRAETRRLQQLRIERARRTTLEYIRRYEELLQELEEEGLAQFVSEELEWAWSQIADLRELVEVDPQAAQRQSIQFAPDVYALPRLARRARDEFVEAERRRQEELRAARQEALRRAFEEIVRRLDDPVVRDFAYDEIRALMSSAQSHVESSVSADELLEQLRRESEVILRRARERAHEWKAKHRTEVTTEAVKDAVTVTEQILREETLGDSSALEALARLRAAVLQQPGAETSRAEVTRHVADVVERAEGGHVSEDDRREIARGVFETLQGLGFVLESPRRVQQGNSDVVIVTARKPAGQRAEIRVSADGQLAYKFDQYVGMQCKEDIDVLLSKLRDVYGVKLSRERVIWQNPDRLSRDAQSPGSDRGERAHG